MLRVPIVQARPGMVLAQPVYHPRRHDTLLLKEGVSLDLHVIGRLREIQCREVWIRYPRLEFIRQYVSPAVNAARANVTAILADTFDAAAAEAHAKLEFGGYRRAVSTLIEKLYENPRAALLVQEMAGAGPELEHASTVCFLSILMGLRLEFYLVRERTRLPAASARDVTNLGLGGLLHDIGMLRLDPSVVDRWERDRDESDRDWRQHVVLGYEMVRGELDPSASAAVLHHHQRFDGSGFPRIRGLGGDTRPFRGSGIHVFARIVAVADLFDRLRRDHPVRDRRSGAWLPAPAVRALKMMQGDPYAGAIDPVVFKGLLAVAPPYPPGSIVRLSNGVRAVVTEWYPTDPCRPRVAELPAIGANLTDDDTERPTHNLLFRKDVEIVEIDGINVSEDNFYPTSLAEFDLDTLSRRLFNGATDDEKETSVA